MKQFLSALCALTLMAMGAHAAPALPKPATATIVGVCEAGHSVLMVAVFTYPDGKVLVADGKHMQGFGTAEEIVRYATTAAVVNEYAQDCTTPATRGGAGTEIM